MPNANQQTCVPKNLFERAVWIEHQLPELIARIPMHLGIAGVSRIEELFFPKAPPIIPLDPTCPKCGLETDDGRVQRVGESFQVVYETCGHVVEMTAAELEPRLGRKP